MNWPRLAGALELHQVGLELNGRALLGPLDLAVAPGEIVTLMGPSGSGKSSLLALICGTLDPAFGSQGEIRLDGSDLAALPPERRRVGILFQDDLLFPHLSVAENLAFGVPPWVRGRKARRQKVREALAEADLEGFGDRDPWNPDYHAREQRRMLTLAHSDVAQQVPPYVRPNSWFTVGWLRDEAAQGAVPRPDPGRAVQRKARAEVGKPWPHCR